MQNRDEDRYKEIEQFQDYELIQCVAYEMAVRAPAIQEILIGKRYYDKQQPNSEYGILYPTDKNEEIWKIFNDHGLEISEVLNPNKQNPDRRYKTGHIQSFLVRHTRNRRAKVDSNFAKSGISGIMINNENIFSGSREESDFNKIPEITLYMARPTLKLPMPNKASIEINFSLPSSEIQAQMAQIKSEVEKSNTAIVSPKDLFSNVDYTDDDHLQKRPRAQKFADWFFAYDLYQTLKAKRNPPYTDKGIFKKIDEELYFHYGKDHSGNRVYSDTHYRKTIIPTMRHFIEDLGYKHLI
jgi:hypothetical protein